MKKLYWIFAVLLAGCSGSGSDGGGSLPPLPGSEPAPMADAFFAQVQTVVAGLPEDTEPTDIGSLASATAPDDSEALKL
jgi:hypothetical protein